MVKHLLSVAAAALLTAGSAMAGVTIGTTAYNSLNDAVGAAQDGDVIEISGQVVIDSRVGFGTQQTYTVKGVGTDAKLVRGEKLTASMLLINGKATANFENLTIDGANKEGVGNKPIEIATGATAASFTDCKFVNHKAERVLFTQQTTAITNVTAENCEVATGLVFVSNGNNKVTVAGASDYTVYLEGANWLNGGENLSGKIALTLNSYAAGQTVVSNCTATDVFVWTAAPENYSLVENGGNIVIAYTKNVITNETQEKSYTSWAAAVAEAAEGDVLVLLEDITLNDRFLNGVNNLTIKGQTADIKLIRNFKNKLFIGANKSTKIENLVLDCNNQDNNNYEFEAGTGTFTLTNVKIINSKTTKGIFNVKDTNRTLSLVNVTVENCETEVPDINLNGKLTLEGNNNLSVNVTFNPGTITVGELTNEAPIALTLPADTELGKVVVSGTTDASKFALTNEGLYLVAGEDNNLVLSDKKSTGIEDVTVSDENAPVEYYNLQGVRISEPAAGQVVIRRQGKNVSKIYVK